MRYGVEIGLGFSYLFHIHPLFSNSINFIIMSLGFINELHTQLHTENLAQVESAILSSDGTISFIQKK